MSIEPNEAMVSRDIRSLRNERRPVCLAIGFFDGLHRGHVRVISAAVTRAREEGGVAWLLTFDPHPSQVLRPGAAPTLLMPTEQKCAYAARAGVDGCMIMPFNRDLARQDPETFVSLLHEAVPTLAHISVGRGWRFGHRRRGDTRLLARMGRRLGYSVSAQRPSVDGGEPISSSRLRQHLQRGELDPVTRMLGRPPSLWGTVVAGERLGRELGYPTANIDVRNETLPPYGIYAVRAMVSGELRDGVLSYGIRPTVSEDATPVVELHLFDFDANLYGQDVEVFLSARIRDEETFDGLDALKRQIGHDCEKARRVLESKKVKESLYIMNWPSL